MDCIYESRPSPRKEAVGKNNQVMQFHRGSHATGLTNLSDNHTTEPYEPEFMEASPGIEPGYKDLQSSA